MSTVPSTQNNTDAPHHDHEDERVPMHEDDLLKIITQEEERRQRKYAVLQQCATKAANAERLDREIEILGREATGFVEGLTTGDIPASSSISSTSTRPASGRGNETVYQTSRTCDTTAQMRPASNVSHGLAMSSTSPLRSESTNRGRGNAAVGITPCHNVTVDEPSMSAVGGDVVILSRLQFESAVTTSGRGITAAEHNTITNELDDRIRSKRKPTVEGNQRHPESSKRRRPSITPSARPAIRWVVESGIQDVAPTETHDLESSVENIFVRGPQEGRPWDTYSLKTSDQPTCVSAKLRKRGPHRFSRNHTGHGIGACYWCVFDQEVCVVRYARSDRSVEVQMLPPELRGTGGDQSNYLLNDADLRLLKTGTLTVYGYPKK